MLYLSRFQPDPSRGAEFLACLWQGPVPADLILHRWLYVGEGPREMVLFWEGGDEAKAYVDQAFGDFGTLSTEPVTDATPGLQACLNRDLDAFGHWLSERGTPAPQVDRQLDVRRRGLHSKSREEAAAAGRAWSAQ
jgi:hypothetical protein